jgi:hypothetical protein
MAITIGDRDEVWRALVLRRYGGWCQWPTCGSRGVHVDRIHSVDEAPDLAFDLGNGIGFCARHANQPDRIARALGNNEGGS